MHKQLIFVNGSKPLSFDPDTGFAVNVDGNAYFGGDFRDVLLSVVGTGNVVVYGSIQKEAPDFTQASAVGNLYSSITLADYTTPQTYYAGPDGVTVDGSATITVELNTNLLSWIGIARDSEDVDVILTMTTGGDE